MPLTEALKETVARFVPYWESAIAPDIRAGKRVLIVAHGNSLRALVKHLDNISDADIIDLNIPTGVPLVYDLADDLTPQGSRYLGDQAAIEQAVAAVAAQGKVVGVGQGAVSRLRARCAGRGARCPATSVLKPR